MTDHAVISGTLVDVRNVGTHKSVKLTIHVPAELAPNIFKAFGWPTDVNPVHVAVARLNERKVMPDTRQHQSTTETTPQERSPSPVAPAALKKSLAQVVGYLCTTESFQRFLMEEYEDDWRACADLFSQDVSHEEIAAEVIRLRCDVKSRRDLSEANAGWKQINNDYRVWSLEVEVVPA